MDNTEFLEKIDILKDVLRTETFIMDEEHLTQLSLTLIGFDTSGKEEMSFEEIENEYLKNYKRYRSLKYLESVIDTALDLLNWLKNHPLKLDDFFYFEDK